MYFLAPVLLKRGAFLSPRSTVSNYPQPPPPGYRWAAGAAVDNSRALGKESEMTLELEKRIVLLLSILDIGGCGTKKQVLDNIEKRSFYNLTRADQLTMKNRNEEVWRNDLAFIRHHLALEGFIDGSRHNSWKISTRGRTYFSALVSHLSSKSHFLKLTKAAVERCSQLQ